MNTERSTREARDMNGIRDAEADRTRSVGRTKHKLSAAEREVIDRINRLDSHVLGRSFRSGVYVHPQDSEDIWESERLLPSGWWALPIILLSAIAWLFILFFLFRMFFMVFALSPP